MTKISNNNNFIWILYIYYIFNIDVKKVSKSSSSKKDEICDKINISNSKINETESKINSQKIISSDTIGSPTLTDGMYNVLKLFKYIFCLFFFI